MVYAFIAIVFIATVCTNQSCKVLHSALKTSWWPCCCLFHWLLRHRRISVPRYRAARHVSNLQYPDETNCHPRAKPEWARQQVIYLAVHLTSCRKVTHAFNRQHGAYASVGKSWVAELIKEHATEIAERRRAMRRQRPAFFEVGHTWALDLTFVVSPDGVTFTVLGIIDHGSRKVLCLQALPTKCVAAHKASRGATGESNGCLVR